ncbi:MAG: FKBP-type peptidyl-prolyl cis-trans isomerase [Planctomycetota bacterium]|jgi:FKBP-type peptidyl-prolyl cis-trans isomerase|nr:FKBP-type peptidyl-prolyl cis-trans isomerase [Planctomycetota bacterium]
MPRFLTILTLLALLAGCGQNTTPNGDPTKMNNSTSNDSVTSNTPSASDKATGTDTTYPGDPTGAGESGTTDSGLAYYVLKSGNGPRPTAQNTVRVHYSGWTLDGKKFDSSVDRGRPAVFPLGGVIAGWTEGLQLMPVGSKYKLVIPAALAYGENPGGGRPGGTLVFDVELLDIVR